MNGGSQDVKSLQKSLVTLGFMPKGADDGQWGGGSKRALKGFLRRAKTIYRLSASGAAADCSPAEVYKGVVGGEITAAAQAEVDKWIAKNWRAPLGRFELKSIGNGRLRQDAADAWLRLRATVTSLGGTLEGPYGDTKRGLGKASKVGASSFSFHIVGRAIDINQEFANPKGQRYFVTKETEAGKTYWRIYCSVASGGKELKKGAVTWYSFSSKKNVDIPAGRYIDLTAEIERDGLFERIPAQGGWEFSYNKTEWWHFQWAPNKQETFSDECELVGISESQLKAAGYSEADMDRKPG